MSIFVGLDCGGSSSRVMAVDAQGAVLYRGHSGAANLATTPEARLRRNLLNAADGCPQPQFACGCFAGLISETVRAKGIAHLRELFPTAQLRVEPDYTAAYYASPMPTDICVIAGTGSLVCSRIGPKVVKSGGRGYLLGDEGSSYQFGRDAVIHFLRNPDEASNTLADSITEQFGTADPNEIVSAIYSATTPASLIGKFARNLGQDAQAGSIYAIASLSRHFGELSDIVEEHFHAHFPDRRDCLNISLAGGLWKSSPIFKEAFCDTLRQRLPVKTLNVVRINRPPLLGAVELAREMRTESEMQIED